MPIKTQGWRPDTHNADFEYQFDTADPDNTMVCTKAVVNGVEQPNPNAVFHQFLAENRRKNDALAEILARCPPGWKRKRYDADGDEIGEELKSKLRIGWQFDEVTRDLTIKVRGVTQGELNALAPHMSARFGNRVKVERDGD